MLRSAQAASSLSVSIESGGTDNTQQSQFNFLVKNTSSAAVSGISVQVYFTSGPEAASSYVFEKYYDSSSAGTVSGPTLLSGSTYYFTVSYGSASLAAGATWQFNTSLHLSDWSSNIAPAGYFYHTGYALGALPSSFATTNYIPAYISGVLNWGSVPGGSGTTAPTATNTTGPTATKTNTIAPSLTPSKTNTPGGPTATKTNTPTFTFTPSKTNTPAATATKTNTPSQTPTFVVSNTPTTVATTPVPATKTPTPGPTSNGTHMSDPFSVSPWFHNPAWDAEVNASSVAANIKADMTQYNTAVWLDSKAAVTGTNGYPFSITGWLDQAVSQNAKLIIFVVYDLPGRDCAALASNGEEPATAAGLTDYETNYINPIVAAESTAKYSGINIINIIEPDSLPNLVTNLGLSACSNVNSLGLYQSGTEYTLSQLHPIKNAYNYIDIGHSGWLGWSSNFGPAITLISNVIKAATGGVATVDGFISDTANTVPVNEPYMTATESIGGSPVQSVTFYSYNPYIEEDTYDAAWATAMQGAGLGTANTNMLVDTSRDGWGGCGGGPNVSQQCRPTAASTATDVATFVTQSRIDRRPARGDWCNQNGAGVGFRPADKPSSIYQAYVWIKPQGESDGSSSLIPTGTSNPGGKGFDGMCDPNYAGNSLNQNSPTNALPNAPVSGAWFEAQFEQLTANAFPALP